MLTYIVRVAIVILLWLPCATVFADSVLGIISQRNAADVVSGAHAFLETGTGHQIQLRTTEQFSLMTQQDRRALLINSDLVFAGGVFGNAANLLLDILAADRAANAGNPVLIKSFVALHSDSRLVPLSHLQDKLMLAGANIDKLMEDPPPDQALDVMIWATQKLDTYAQYRGWLLAKTFWSDRDASNMAGMFTHLFTLLGHSLSVPIPTLRPSLRISIGDTPVDPGEFELDPDKKWVAILDYETGDRPGERALVDMLCQQLNAVGHGCLRVFAKWGAASIRAIELLHMHKGHIAAIVSVQNFVVGGGEGREAVNSNLAQLNVPVLKGIRLTDKTEEQWHLSEAGIRQNSVHYRVAMPELQGISQPLVVAAITPQITDEKTGIQFSRSRPIDSQVDLLARRTNRWLALQTTLNADKKVAIVYYNHPPGRHNIGADNLNVPSSLFTLLHRLKKEGYETGELPATELELLDGLQRDGINLPEDRQALISMAERVTSVSVTQYKQWFAGLSKSLQQEMESGPLGFLHGQLQRAVKLEDRGIGQALVARVTNDLRHAVEGADHPARDRVLSLLSQLEAHYNNLFTGEAAKDADWLKALELVEAIGKTGLEGIRGWGPAPGNVMVHNENILIPGIRFGNIFIGPQPPRGWELNEELLHANLSFPPTHQYLAFYQWLRYEFEADAVVHLGRHSTYEFLPRHRVGLGLDDYPIAALDDLPSIYPYIVDGVGEGIQAKRRGLAVMVDHLTPPLASTELYDQLLQLRQLVESFEAAPNSATSMRERAVAGITELVDELKLEDELVKSMAGELEVRGVTTFDQVDDELLVHEVGHYLTKLQEDFMPLGLHTFGQDWSVDAVDTMLISMAQDDTVEPQWRDNLTASPAAEMRSLLSALSGGYVEPAKGNDPIRTPDVLPTGRNFFALDGGLIPSKIGYAVGVELATNARLDNPTAESEAVILWASDVVRDEGALIAFGYDMLGVKPVWSSRGIIKGLERLPVSELKEGGKARTRKDVLFTTSGLFRDLYGAHLIWLEQAVLLALDASSNVILKDYPALTSALESTLTPLGTLRNRGDEALDINLLAARWVKDASAALNAGQSDVDAGMQASYRVFGDPPGAYGAGVNTMVERSGNWRDRSEIATVYKNRMGHAYGMNLNGEPQRTAFEQRLSHVGNTYLGQSSNLYGLLDNNDTFDYLGGLSLAVEFTRGVVPENFILVHPDNSKLSIEPLGVALLSELRGRFLNPQWLMPLMDEGYAGARTMGSEFIEYLWGWQVTNPDVVKSWVWDEVKAVYIDDKLDIQLDAFLEQNHNVHVKSNMLAVMLVAAEKQFWQANEETLQQLAGEFAQLIIEHGLPGSGHTTPNHPVFDFIEQYVSAEQYAQVQQLLLDTRIESEPQTAPNSISEITLAQEDATNDTATPDKPIKPDATVPEHASDAMYRAHEKNSNESLDDSSTSDNNAQSTDLETVDVSSEHMKFAAALLLMLLVLGLFRGMRSPKKSIATNGTL